MIFLKIRKYLIIYLVVMLVVLLGLNPNGKIVYAEELITENYILNDLGDGTAIISEYTGISKDVVIPSEIDGLKIIGIGDKAFYSMNLNSVIIPDTIEYIGDLSFSYNNFTSINIPGSVKTTGIGSFADNELEEVILNEGIERIGDSSFQFNYNLKSVNFPSSLKYIDDYAFRSTILGKIDLNDGLLEIRRGAFASSELEELTLPNSLTIIGDSSFSDNYIESLTLNEGLLEIGEKAFYSNRITTVNLPSTLDTINESAFERNLISSLVIPTNITTIFKKAFMGNRLTDVTLSSCVEYIGRDAFQNNIGDTVRLSNYLIASNDTNFLASSDTNLLVSNFGGVTNIISVSGSIAEEYAFQNSLNFIDSNDDSLKSCLTNDIGSISISSEDMIVEKDKSFDINLSIDNDKPSDLLNSILIVYILDKSIYNNLPPTPIEVSSFKDVMHLMHVSFPNGDISSDDLNEILDTIYNNLVIVNDGNPLPTINASDKYLYNSSAILAKGEYELIGQLYNSSMNMIASSYPNISVVDEIVINPPVIVPPVIVPPVVDPPVVVPPVVDPPVVDPPVIDPPVVGPPVVDLPVEEEYEEVYCKRSDVYEIVIPYNDISENGDILAKDSTDNIRINMNKNSLEFKSIYKELGEFETIIKLEVVGNKLLVSAFASSNLGVKSLKAFSDYITIHMDRDCLSLYGLLLDNDASIDGKTTSLVFVRNLKDGYSPVPHKLTKDKIELKILSVGSFSLLEDYKSFNDIKNVSERDLIETLKIRLISHGVTPTDYKPKNLITRAQFVALVSRSLDINSSGKLAYTDIKDKWFENEVQSLFEVGVLTPSKNGKFNAYEIISEKDIISVLSNVLKREGIEDSEKIIRNLIKEKGYKVTKGSSGYSNGVGFTREQSAWLIVETLKIAEFM